MENNPYNVKELADKLEKGTITPQEMACFQQWYSGFDDEEVLLSGSKHHNIDDLKTSIFNSIEAQMETPVQPKHKVITIWRTMAAAAAIVVLLGFGALYKNQLLNVVNPVHQVEMLSKAGQHRQVILPDGTRVWLNPSTSISYPDNFRGAQRLVKLEGEAFFDVKHDADHPFIITSGPIKTVVLGTSFNVKAYPGAATAEVTVVSGKVGVAEHDVPKAQEQIMIANQRTVLTIADRTLVKEDYSGAQKFLEQRNGLFSFDGTAMQQVAGELTQQYGINIQIDASLAKRGFYGHLKTTEPITQTLNKLCAVMDASWTKAGNTYRIQQIPSQN